ncbi:hypothetical protein EV359DRAFT_52041 [Lentinula novae-zelandiae]|nr:hypothetical protein EV359DRAFT_52041 [Lentinula novae-zelandiae]
MWWQGRKHAGSVEVHTAQDGFDVPQHSRISKPAWMGLRASADIRGSIQDAIAECASNTVHTILEGITRIPYVPHLAVAVCDLSNHMFLYRSQLTPNILGCILPDVNAAVPKFVRSITHGFSEDDMQNNSHGDHWFSIAGHDRNNHQCPEATKFQKNNHLAIARAFAPAQCYQDSVDYTKAKFGIHAMFGLFFNFCLNSAREGVPRVFCRPHVDWKNTAFVTTQNGEKPTRENSTPLYSCTCSSHDQNSPWAKAEGRGSKVWFNQASMFQTSELGINTLREAKEAGMDTNCDQEFWLEQGVFPTTLPSF